MKTENFKISASAVTTKVVVEPWGTSYLIPKGSCFEVVFQGPDDGKMEIEKTPAGFVLYGWAGSTYSASLDDLVLSDDTAAAPMAPLGMSIREFTKSLFQKANESNDH
jgi:hypothetical protein